MKKSMLRGLPNASCQYGKAHELPYEKSRYRVERPLELIHLDVFGPVKQPSINRNRYMIIFINDFSRFAWVDFMKEKSKALMKFKQFKEKTEKEVGCKI